MINTPSDNFNQLITRLENMRKNSCNRRMIMSPFGQIEMTPRITISKGDCDEKRGDDFNDNQGTEEAESD